MESLGMVQEAKVVVGLDFGTTFSGFAYAHRAAPERIYTFYEWPMEAEGGGIPYCKTPTSLLYVDASTTTPSESPFQLQEWGWPAIAKYKSGANEATFNLRVPKPSGGRSRFTASASGGRYLLRLFKLHLATATDAASAPALPPRMTARKAIVDYLAQISKFILEDVQSKFGSHISLDDVQWCITTPAIWDERAKSEMRTCSEIAGLVQGPQSKGVGSPHQLKLFIEPEAASIYCQLKLEGHVWSKGDKFLVVDCGGGTVDLVLHEKLGSAPSVSVRELQESSGAMCGGSRVDEEFFNFLRRKIRCFSRFETAYPATALAFRQDWERVKCDYGGEDREVAVELPFKLATMWEEDDVVTNNGSFDELQLTNDDMKSIFDPVVDEILHLIEERMVPGLNALMVVGGFSASPYLMRRIRETFGGRVAAIASPPFPGSAICCGAVTMGIRSDTVVSRISKKTYGIKVVIPFVTGVHPENSKTTDDSGRPWSRIGFCRYACKGDEVQFDQCVKREHTPFRRGQTNVALTLYSSDRESATYTRDPGMRKEGTFTIKCPSFNELGFWPEVEVAMFFGRTEIQVSAVGKNFDSKKEKMLPVKFERDSIF